MARLWAPEDGQLIPHSVMFMEIGGYMTGSGDKIDLEKA